MRLKGKVVRYVRRRKRQTRPGEAAPHRATRRASGLIGTPHLPVHKISRIYNNGVGADPTYITDMPRQGLVRSTTESIKINYNPSKFTGAERGRLVSTDRSFR